MSSPDFIPINDELTNEPEPEPEPLETKESNNSITSPKLESIDPIEYRERTLEH